MKQSEENFLNMVHTVLENLSKVQSVWSSETVIVKEVAAIERDYTLILGSLNLNSRLDSSEQSHPSDEDLDAIIRATIKLCRRMYIYACHQNDEIIQKMTDHTEASLASGNERMLIRRCSTILSRAEWIQFFLKPYKVDSSQLTELRRMIDVYNQQYGDYSKSKSHIFSIKRSISDQMRQLKSRLNLLDELIDYLITNDSFVTDYRRSRIVANYTEGKASDN